MNRKQLLKEGFSEYETTVILGYEQLGNTRQSIQHSLSRTLIRATLLTIAVVVIMVVKSL